MTGVLRSRGGNKPIGYKAGAGGVVTQLTSRATAVTLNALTGAITLFSVAGSATLGSTNFVVNNALVEIGDTIVVNQRSGTDDYMISVTDVTNGTFKITANTTAGTTVEAPVFNFAVFKGSSI